MISLLVSRQPMALDHVPNRNATWAPLGAQVGCQVGPTWAAQVGPTTFCPGGPHGAQVGLSMCDTIGTHVLFSN